MKLQKRVTLLCSLVIMLTLLCADAVILGVSAKMLGSDAEQQGLAESYAVWSAFERYTANPAAASDDSVKYYFKASHDNHTACFAAAGHRELYNNTVFTYRDLAGGAYKASSARITVKRVSYAERRLLVFRMDSERFILFHITDLQSAVRRFSALAAVCITASLLIASAAVIAISLLLRRSMKPLAKLSRYAAKMAGGDYSERIVMEKDDEVGQLGREFNKMADAIERRRDDLAREMEKRRLFMGSLTHELKTPLTAISGYAQTMQRTRLSHEEESFALSYINSECMRLSHLSRKMMTLLELEGTFAPELAEVPVDSLFARVVNTCAPTAHDRGVTLVYEPSTLLLRTDRELFTDVLVNLTDNAVKASPPGAQVRLCAAENGIVVEDKGCGIPEAEIEKIFEPFYTVDRSRSRKNGGAGLGLALIALIADKLGMELTVESCVGEGTRVTIYNLMMY